MKPSDIKRLEASGAKITRTSKVEPEKPEIKPEPVQTVEPQVNRREDRLAIAQATAESKRAINAALAHADKIAEALQLSHEQATKLLDVLTEIERERNKPKRAIIHRNKDKLIETVDFITLE